MSLYENNNPVKVVWCQCKKASIIPDSVRDAAAHWLERNGIACECVEDLCALAARKDPVLKSWAGGGKLLVIACFERAVRGLFALGGATLDTDVCVINQRTVSGDDISSLLDSLALPQGPKTEITSPDSWVPWFPVMDAGRCVNCRQCLNFCLFGVYALNSEGRVEVVRPASCKTGCPACARVCPTAAIIFAKYTESPFQGDAVDEAKLAALRNTGDFKKFLADNLQKRLKMRMGQAASDEKPDIDRMSRALDIPDHLKSMISTMQPDRPGDKQP